MRCNSRKSLMANTVWGLSLCFVAPFSHAGLTKFYLNNVTFVDGGVATGYFSIDLNSITPGSTYNISDYSIKVTNPDLTVGANYTPEGVNSGSDTGFICYIGECSPTNFGLQFRSGPFFSVGYAQLNLWSPTLSPSQSNRLSIFDFGLVNVNQWASQEFVNCNGSVCAQREITSGSIDTQLIPATVPLSSTTFLLLSSLAGLGLAARRRDKKI